MNADERGLKTGSLSAFIGVHLRLPVIFSHLLTVAALYEWPVFADGSQGNTLPHFGEPWPRNSLE